MFIPGPICRMSLFVTDDGSRADLHEMLVPSAIKGSWNNVEDHVHLSSYYIEFSPDPADRIYRPFGLFVKMPLPVEAEKMELDLHLARGRSVKTKLIPSGVTGFDKDEVAIIIFYNILLNFCENPEIVGILFTFKLCIYFSIYLFKLYILFSLYS